jgi:hypothetical protein
VLTGRVNSISRTALRWIARLAAVLPAVLPAVLFAVLFAMASPAMADTIDLSSRGSFTLSHGQEMTVRFSVWNYGYNNPGVSPYPTSIGLELVGANPQGAQLSAIPGSSGQYFPDFLLQGTLESLDGTAVAPLQSPAGALLGMSAGSLLLTPAMFYGSGGSSAVAEIAAEAALSLNLSEQIFGPDVASRQSSALLVLRNLGADLTIGVGNDVSLRNAITEPSITGFGSVATSGITDRVTVTTVPEPRTVALTLALLFGLGVLLVRRARA